MSRKDEVTHGSISETMPFVAERSYCRDTLLPDTDVRIPSNEAFSRGAPRVGSRQGRITLVRHGRPDLSRAVKLDWRGFDQWWQSYDRSGLCSSQSAPSELAEHARTVPVILSSTLIRAKETALALAEGRVFDSESLFVEAPLPAPRLPGLRVSPSVWGVLSRVAWLFGFSGGQESHLKTRTRVDLAADRLIAMAASEDVMLCAHGWFNLMLGQALRRRGWVRVRNGGSAYWSWSVYEPPAVKVGAPTPTFREKVRLKLTPAYSKR